MNKPDAILIAGPTASGKSKLAIELAERFDGEIVNTDSMQIYPVLDVLSARPDHEDLARLPHHLYGMAPLHEPYSVAKWLEAAKTIANDLWERGKCPVFVGGTGLYFKALDEGIAETPKISSSVRDSVRSDLIEQGSEALHRRLSELDPNGAEVLRPSDSHRITRALEVVLSTGNTLKYYQDRQPETAGLLQGKNCLRFVIMPERAQLHERINARTELMLDQGAALEVDKLLALNLPSDATVLKAIGVPQLRALLAGEISREEAIRLIQAATRQYAKRQSTWFRGQFGNKWITKQSVNDVIQSA